MYNPQDPAGASRTPGRWHTLGYRILYFCSSLALSILELKANSVSFSAIRKEYHYIDIEIIDNLTIEEAPKSLYTKDWILNRKKTQDFGIGWYKSLSSPILKIRSAVLPTDDNYIINTTHPDFLKLKFSKPKPILLDSRII